MGWSDDPVAAVHELILAARSLSDARRAHASAAVRGALHRHLPTSAALILTYSTFHDPASAIRLFAHSPLKRRGAFLWNALVAALSRSNLHADALAVYNSMIRSTIRPDDRTFPFLLTACTAASAACKGKETHASLLKLGFNHDVFVNNTLVAFYGACCAAADARKVFDEMPERDIITWNSMISVFSTNGLFTDSLNWFLELTRTGMSPVNAVSLISVLPVCAAINNVDLGRGIHGYSVKVGLDECITVSNALVDIYGKCGYSNDSVRFFVGMPEKNDASWNAIIGSLVKHAGKHHDALQMFRGMMSNKVKPNSMTMASLLPALVELGFFNLGREVHGYCVTTGMDHDVFVGNSLVNMYAKFGLVKQATHIFYGLGSRNVVSWNVLIANFAQNGAELEAIRLVSDMQGSGECPNSVTLTNVLPACSRIASLEKGKEIHARAIRMGFQFDLFVSNALIDMYAKCRRLDLARNVFDISERDQVSYNTLIGGYSESQLCFEALPLFVEMRSIGLEHDDVSFMGALSACANMSSLKQGKEIHCLSVRNNSSTHLFVANSLLDFYTKCGKLGFARKIFDSISNKDVTSWNSMILGYGMQGELGTAINLFDSMESEGLEYDHVSYIAALSACRHGGMVEIGKKYFNQMLAQNIKLTQMHYAGMVDLFGRAGMLKEAAEFINSMPFEADSNVWGALLGACRVHGNIELGRWAAEHLFELKPDHSGYYILLMNMYAEAGRWDEANEIRELMKLRSVKKSPGCTWIETGNKMYAYVVGERIEGPEMELCYAEHG